MSKIYVLITDDTLRVSSVNPLSIPIKSEFLHIEVLTNELNINITYNYSDRIKNVINLIIPINDGMNIIELCTDMIDNLSSDFQNEIRGVYPGSRVQQKLYNFFLIGVSVYVSTIEIIKSTEIPLLFDPWEIIIPEYTTIDETCNVLFYKCLEYYINPILKSGGVSGVTMKVISIIRNFWMIFDDCFKEVEIDDAIVPIYGSIFNMYKFLSENKCETRTINQVDVLSELEIKHLEYVERSETIYNLFSDASRDLEESRVMCKEVNGVMDECNIYASELKEYVRSSRIQLSEDMHRMLESHNRKLEEFIGEKISDKINSLDDVISRHFKSMEDKHEFKLIRTIDDTLFKRDELLLGLTSKYNEFQKSMTKFKQDAITEFKNEVGTYNRNSLAEHRDVSNNVHKYKIELDKYLQLKKTEFEVDISKIIEREGSRVVDEHLRIIGERISVMFDSKTEEFSKTILLLADRIKALEDKK